MTREEQNENWANLCQDGKEEMKAKYAEFSSKGTLESRGYCKGLANVFGEHNLKPALTYEDVARELFMGKEVFYFKYDEHDSVDSNTHALNDDWYPCPLNCTSEQQAYKLSAINKLLNVAKYLNKNEDGSDWVPDWENENDKKWYPCVYEDIIISFYTTNVKQLIVYFRSEELLKQAVQILGEDVVRTALGNY